MHLFSYSLLADVPAHVAAQSGALKAIPEYTNTGCWIKHLNLRTLLGPASASVNMTVEICASFCTGYQYFGVEYAQEVRSIHLLSLAKTLAADDSKASFSGAIVTIRLQEEPLIPPSLIVILLVAVIRPRIMVATIS
jgi:hypothetical protein